MKAHQRRLERLKDLAGAGELLLLRAQPEGRRQNRYTPLQDTIAWYTSCLTILDGTLGKASEHYLAFRELRNSEWRRDNKVKAAVGVLQSAIADVEGGHLDDIRALLHADLFDELLEQAQELHESGYSAPAAVVAGCVLEDHLRALIRSNGLALGARPKLNSMNTELSKAGVFDKLTMKRVTALADIRNSAAHGNWDSFEADDVMRMIRDVRDLVSRFRA